MGKGEIARYEQFLRFPQCFQTACFPGASKGVIVWEWVKHLLLLNGLASLDQTWQECSLGILFKNCSQNMIPSKPLVAMATKWNFPSNSLNIFSSGTAGQILKLFHRNIPWVTLFKNCSRNLDPSINMALVNEGYLHYMDIKKFLKILL